MTYTHAALAVLVFMVGWVILRTEQIMATVREILDAENKEKTTLEAQNGLIKQLLTAFAGGTFTPDQAQSLLNDITTEDAEATSNISVISAALSGVGGTPTT